MANEKNATGWLLKEVKQDLKGEKSSLKKQVLMFLNTFERKR
ncbi:hypothetical protein [Pseudoalteromonas phenolica]|nr:hypothetical protein [Pseudoalteromonas phenolica]